MRVVTLLIVLGVAGSSRLAGQQAPPPSTTQPTGDRFEVLTEEMLTPRQKTDWDDYARLRPGALAQFGRSGLIEIVTIEMLYSGAGAAHALSRHVDARGMPLTNPRRY